jgi:hypothetical protein
MKLAVPEYLSAKHFLNRESFMFISRPAVYLKYTFLFFINSLLLISSSWSQPDAYLKTITDRAVKIVNTLSVKDSSIYNNTVQALVNQYSALNKIQEDNKAIADLIKKEALSADETAARLKSAEEKKTASLQQLHTMFIGRLQQLLSPEQVDLVKDGMTYRVFPITYAAYQDMIPTLTETQKSKIYDWLKEARELAMDAESSDKKHAVFGKYKGRINNYLSAEGYDLKKATEDWQKRIKERNKPTLS